jgi:hypothetical protein
VTGLPPGEYWVAAVDALAPGDWQTGDVLDTLVGRAERIKVADGQVATVALRLSRR